MMRCGAKTETLFATMPLRFRKVGRVLQWASCSLPLNICYLFWEHYLLAHFRSTKTKDILKDAHQITPMQGSFETHGTRRKEFGKSEEICMSTYMYIYMYIYIYTGTQRGHATGESFCVVPGVRNATFYFSCETVAM